MIGRELRGQQWSAFRVRSVAADKMLTEIVHVHEQASKHSDHVVHHE